MTDRELLELAAKAAGIDVSTARQWPNGTYIFLEPRKPRWNPLTDDGDAFRLMVACHIINELQTAIELFIDEDEWEEDSLASTRRAIVIAAAGIGRGMA